MKHPLLTELNQFYLAYVESTQGMTPAGKLIVEAAWGKLMHAADDWVNITDENQNQELRSEIRILETELGEERGLVQDLKEINSQLKGKISTLEPYRLKNKSLRKALKGASGALFHLQKSLQ